MNIGKLYEWDNIPKRDVFLSTGECVGTLVDGIEFYPNSNDCELRVCNQGRSFNVHIFAEIVNIEGG